MSHALIVGGSGSIGSAVKSAAESRGIRVTSTTRRDLDVTSDTSIASFARQVSNVDHVLFAQGLQPSTNLERTTREHLNRMLDVHVTSTLIALQHLVPKLNAGASIVLISSVAVKKGSYDPGYAAAKGALATLVTSLAAELRAKARVNAVAPGLVAGSPVHQSMQPEHAERHSSRMFGNRLIEPEHVASAVLELWTNPSINAAVIPIDGGYFG
jgi:NAD(P)-dependent dehydrogenase (short-subunit alcohol dehydrogenase family)